MAIRQSRVDKRIEDLERRVRELEARPYWPPAIIIQPAPAPQPSVPYWQPYQGPFYQPAWYVASSTTTGDIS